MQRKIKEAVKEFPLGVHLTEVIKTVNRKLSGWAQYFKVGNSYDAALKLSNFACLQLRIFWRRRKQRKDIKWIPENGRMITFIIKDYIMFQNYLDRCRMKREECQVESRVRENWASCTVWSVSYLR